VEVQNVYLKHNYNPWYYLIFSGCCCS